MMYVEWCDVYKCILNTRDMRRVETPSKILILCSTTWKKSFYEI